ncbi:MAG: hypothetical protein K2X28_07915 [Alphaproteobacteria bacterium]|nr:hypothetical protein [Alphaproteobacteria bacterium]
MDAQKPWSLKKSEDPKDIARIGTALYVLAEIIRHVAIYVQSLMPASASKILDQLGQTERTFEAVHILLKSGTPL